MSSLNSIDSSHEGIRTAVVKGRVNLAIEAVEEALDAGIPVEEIISTFVETMAIVGERWIAGEMFIPEVIASARAVQAGQDLLLPRMESEHTSGYPRVVIGTVLGDMHDIGKNLVRLMLTSAGFDVRDLGVNVAPGAFVDAVRETSAGIVCLSALLTTTMPQMRVVLNGLAAQGMRDATRVVIGGACVSSGFADEIGADGYGSNAAEGVVVCKEMAAGTTERM